MTAPDSPKHYIRELIAGSVAIVIISYILKAILA